MDEIVYVIGGAGKRSSLKFYKNIVEKASLKIACDSGIKIYREINVVPDILIGDFDSASPEDLEWAKKNGCEILTYPAEKEEIDTELALIVLRERKEKDVIISGVLGDRIDQEVASLYLLVEYIDLNPCILEEDVKIGVVSGFKEEDAFVGETWSILRIGDKVEGLTLEGFKYELKNKDLNNFRSLGISNEAISNKVRIFLKKGTILFVRWINKKW
ncbi:thiamine diphosphokinase [Petrotoga sp. 9PWA.NaAc.5.4]|uniref:thiamine diphosphokinase n=1 Tax=Petrotoga sp. 9PWA.NaAc.5.4 TaxID=1434328 RepID=UPI000CAD2DCD|nr:thiamine diphosphokinase [Petrotoga sp. 9PWA.NaAc.5.4]PNR94161.1 hypothetical protein X924_06995 [Petrotoga sp. 9PWA.NaAc.5.4]